jgi:hypothetical protein
MRYKSPRYTVSLRAFAIKCPFDYPLQDFLAKHGNHVGFLDLDGDAGSALQACPSVDTLLFSADWPLSSPSSIASANEN